MKLGLFDHMQKHDIPGRSYIDLYKSHLELVEMADQEGMDFYFVAEHHFDATHQRLDVADAEVGRRLSQVPHQPRHEPWTVVSLEGDLLVVDDERLHGLTVAVRLPDAACARGTMAADDRALDRAGKAGTFMHCVSKRRNRCLASSNP